MARSPEKKGGSSRFTSSQISLGFLDCRHRACFLDFGTLFSTIQSPHDSVSICSIMSRPQRRGSLARVSITSFFLYAPASRPPPPFILCTYFYPFLLLGPYSFTCGVLPACVSISHSYRHRHTTHTPPPLHTLFSYSFSTTTPQPSCVSLVH